MNEPILPKQQSQTLFSESCEDDSYGVIRYIVPAGEDGLFYTQRSGWSHFVCISGIGQIIIIDPPKTLPEGNVFNFNRGDHHQITEGANFQILNHDENNMLLAIEIDQPRQLN